jgi:lipopolysaccharide biosynthesis glycosyltransferase
MQIELDFYKKKEVSVFEDDVINFILICKKRWKDLLYNNNLHIQDEKLSLNKFNDNFFILHIILSFLYRNKVSYRN